MKKSVSLVVIFTLLISMCCGAITAAAATPDFKADYTGLKAGQALPESLTVLTGRAAAGGGYVEIASNSIVYINTEKARNFTFEVDFTITQANEDTRWVSFMYRVGGTGADPKPYMQMCVRRGATAANGVEIAAKNTAGGWEYNDRNSFTENIDPQTKYTAAVIADGKKISQKINGQEIVNTESALLNAEGGFALQTNGSVMRVYGIRLSAPQSLDQPDQSEVIRTLYQPKTSLIAAPTVVELIDSAAKFSALKEAKTPPQAAYFRVEAGENAAQINAGSIHPLKEAFDACRGCILPVFEAADETCAKQLMQYAAQNKETDFLVVSSSAEAIAAVTKAGIATVRTGLILPKGTAAVNAAHSTHKAGANICVMSELTRENAEYLQKRFLSVMLTPDAQTTKNCVYAAVDCGANSVVVPSANEAYEIYAAVTGANAFVRRAFVVGHRGLPAAAPENTVESALEAVKAGADAIECDVYVTKDNQLVINHNGNIQGYTTDPAANKNVESMTREELKSYTLKPVGKYKDSKFAFLDEYFDALKEYPDVLHVIEIKTGNSKCASMIRNLAEEKGVLDQIVIISFNADQLIRTRKVMPEIGASLLYSGASQQPLKATERIYQLTAKMGGAFSPDSSILDGTVEALRFRGINCNIWTVDGESAVLSQAKRGAAFITTNTANYSGSLLKAEGAMNAEALFDKMSAATPTVSPTVPPEKIPDTGEWLALLWLILPTAICVAGIIYLKKRRKTAK